MQGLFDLMDQLFTTTLKCTVEGLDTLGNEASGEEIDTVNTYISSCIEDTADAVQKQAVIDIFKKYNIETGLTNEN